MTKRNGDRRLELYHQGKMQINEMARMAHANARAKGFWDEPREVGTILALIHSEVSEALEAHQVITNDRNIISFDGSRIKGVDKGNPRAEIYIKEDNR